MINKVSLYFWVLIIMWPPYLSHDNIINSSSYKAFTEFIGGFPPQMPVTRSFDVCLISAWTNSWASNGNAGDLRRNGTHYDAILMIAFIDTWEGRQRGGAMAPSFNKRQIVKAKTFVARSFVTTVLLLAFFIHNPMAITTINTI